MRLEQYLSENDISLSDFAATIGRSVATVSRITRDRNRPDWKTMERIVAKTNGEVRPNDFLGGQTEAAT
jgi:transcriptional regulator with XRE-family HTH domain